MKIILTEKPSVARDIANVFQISTSTKNYFKNENYTITWAFGHLISLAQPEEIDPKYKEWSLAYLPIVPVWSYSINPKSASQFKIIKELFNQRDVTEIICATDAGREGEYIFGLIYRLSGTNVPVKRLWISSLTPESILEGFKKLLPGQDFLPLFQAADCRAKADWLIGINFTRLLSIKSNQLITVGRVQTPTLAMIVDRNEQVISFQKTKYYELILTIRGIEFKYFSPEGESSHSNQHDLETILTEVNQVKRVTIDKVEVIEKKELAPPFLNLLNLQKLANDKFGFTAEQTLGHAQTLYEKHKVITYPRTESNHVSKDVELTFGPLLKQLNTESSLKALKYFTDIESLSKKYVDDTKLTDHHAIIPTGKFSNNLTNDEKQIYALIYKSFLAVFYPCHCIENQTICFFIDSKKFVSTQNRIIQLGWRELFPSDQVKSVYVEFREGGVESIETFNIFAKETNPPKQFTESTLLTAMKNAGNKLDDKSLSNIINSTGGLGTPATRAQIIERLVSTNYIVRKSKSLIPTDKGISLIKKLPVSIKSPLLTAKWERVLSQIEDENYNPDDFLKHISHYVTYSYGELQQVEIQKTSINLKSFGRCPLCADAEVVENSKFYYCNKFRETGCMFSFPKVIASKKIPADQVKLLISKGRSKIIKGFKSKTKKSFDARLTLDYSDSKPKLEFMF